MTPELLALRLLVGPAASGEPPPPGTAKAPPSEEAIAREGEVDLATRKKDKFKRPGSPQRFELEFKLGPYLPAVDRRYNGPGLGPYATLFGETDGEGVAIAEPKPGVMPAVAFEWQFYYLAGTLGLGVQIAFFRDKASALLTNPMDDDNTVRSEADDVTFGVVPIAVQFAYRFSLLADRFRVPLVPYGKIGPAYGVWWTRNGSGNLARDSNGNRGAGGVWGWQLNAGLMLRLDFIERSTAKRLDQTTGINHTYLFGEYQLSRLDNFGAGNSIAVGDSTFFGGLAIEF